MTRRCKARWTTVVIAAATLTVSCAMAPRERSRAPVAGSEGAGEAPTNDALANAVYSRLNADPVYYFRHVDVSVDHGIANLSGYVWSTEAIYHARYIAQSVPGVTGVVTSQLELERNGRADGVTR
jgi:osmotically-inducible protein OsmY